nr:MAG TPA: ATP-dependent DNA helicase [Bacteriophage sp.]
MSQSTSETDSNGDPIKLYGIIDLLVIDSKGNAHIIDYKTSIHDYLGFSDPKIYAYSY